MTLKERVLKVINDDWTSGRAIQLKFNYEANPESMIRVARMLVRDGLAERRINNHYVEYRKIIKQLNLI